MNLTRLITCENKTKKFLEDFKSSNIIFKTLWVQHKITPHKKNQEKLIVSQDNQKQTLRWPDIELSDIDSEARSSTNSIEDRLKHPDISYWHGKLPTL